MLVRALAFECCPKRFDPRKPTTAKVETTGIKTEPRVTSDISLRIEEPRENKPLLTKAREHFTEQKLSYSSGNVLNKTVAGKVTSRLKL